MPFVCPPTAHSNIDCSCSIKNGSSDPAEKGKQHQEVPLSPDAAESQRAVSGNHLVSREESPPGRSWSLGDAGQGLPGGRRQKKRPEKFGQKSVACQEAHQRPDRSLKMDTLGAKKAEGNVKALGSSEGIARHQQVGHSLGGSKDGEEDVTERRCPPSPNPEAVWKRQRRDLLPNLAVFRELDAHVLRVSGQLKPKRGLWSVQTVVSLIAGGASSQLEKARAIWVWLCQNIEYDVCGFLGLSKKIHLPQEVLQTGRGVCSGYAHLFCEMCK
ncbi:kyphoscoliosis peptidase-like [Python bivittatus]|uniref:Kyphoscoliosis peptidase-like n=1 Tax=Python bivittatus TaxID=176946 RepID=A0A9F2R7U7_PYTBI|nr:kyphoscoliosis peptidase-like [Python bivittatus]